MGELETLIGEKCMGDIGWIVFGDLPKVETTYDACDVVGAGDECPTAPSS